MDFSILDTKGNVVATAYSAREARTKFRAGRGLFGKQTILDQIGAPISEADLERLCTAEDQKDKPVAQGQDSLLIAKR